MAHHLGSKLVKQHWQRWSEQGLLVFFLPPYSPQMNRIEDEWLHLKRESLASRLFEDEYDLAVALIEAIRFAAYGRAAPQQRQLLSRAFSI